MTELDGKSEDLVQDNIQALTRLFPEVACDGKVDFHKLRNLLGDAIDNASDRYNFTWHGKDAALRLSQTPSMGTLRPCKAQSKDWDTTQNLYIEGDNLEVLKLLQKSYHGRVKMIYIDPPYNTGNDFVYHDDFRDNLANYQRLTGQADEAGKVYTTNSETSGRYHTDWLNMIYPRLRLARNLLREDGVIFISIDDHEQGNLRKVCDEIFGEDNFVAELVWERAYSPKNDAKYISNSHDYVLMYAKAIDDFKIGRLPRTEEANARYSNPDNDPRGVWKASDMSVKTYNADCDYPITTPSGRIVEPPAGRCWSLSRKAFRERLQDNRIWFGPDGNGTPAIKRFLTELKFQGMAPTSILFYKEVGHSQEGAQEVSKLLDGGFFSGPKPVRLLERLETLANLEDDSLVLDFFSGSGSTAHATMKMNAEHDTHRRYILVQIPEPCATGSEAYKANYKTICDIGEERIRRAGEQYKDKGVDIGFRVFQLDTSNLKKWQPPKDDEELEQTLVESVSNILPGRTEEDLLYEIILKMGFDLAWPIETRTVADTQVFVVADGALFICLADRITPAVAEGMAQLHRELAPEVWKVVCRDTGFRDDAAKVNVREILKAEGLDDAAFVTV